MVTLEHDLLKVVNRMLYGVSVACRAPAAASGQRQQQVTIVVAFMLGSPCFNLRNISGLYLAVVLTLSAYSALAAPR
jgi:hypothetical protein